LHLPAGAGQRSRTQTAPLIISTTPQTSTPRSITSRARHPRRPAPLPRRQRRRPNSAHTTRHVDRTSRSRQTPLQGLLQRVETQTNSVCSGRPSLMTFHAKQQSPPSPGVPELVELRGGGGARGEPAPRL